MSVCWLLVVASMSQAPAGVRAVPEIRVFGSPDLGAFVLFDGVEPPDAGTSTFVIQNVGRGPLAISKMELFGDDAGVFSLESATPVLGAGDSLEVAVQYRPAVTGTYSARVLIESNEPQRRNSDLVLCARPTAGSVPYCDAPLPLPFRRSFSPAPLAA